MQSYQPSYTLPEGRLYAAPGHICPRYLLQRQFGVWAISNLPTQPQDIADLVLLTSFRHMAKPPQLVGVPSFCP